MSLAEAACGGGVSWPQAVLGSVIAVSIALSIWAFMKYVTS